MIRSLSKAKHQAGFTIVEMLVATAVFTVVMVVIASVIIMFSNSQRKAVNEAAVQSTSRNLVNTISDALKFQDTEAAAISHSDGSQGWCMGSVRLSYMLGQQYVSGNQHGAVVDRTGIGCSGAAQPINSGGTVVGSELLGEGMRMSNISITSNNGLYDVVVRVILGPDDLLCSQDIENSCVKGSGVNLSAAQIANTTNLECKPGADARFCAVSELSTTVRSRL